MLALGIFRDRTFSASNAMTFLVYGALGAMSFFVTLAAPDRAWGTARWRPAWRSCR